MNWSETTTIFCLATFFYSSSRLSVPFSSLIKLVSSSSTSPPRPLPLLLPLLPPPPPSSPLLPPPPPSSPLLPPPPPSSLLLLLSPSPLFLVSPSSWFYLLFLIVSSFLFNFSLFLTPGQAPEGDWGTGVGQRLWPVHRAVEQTGREEGRG